MVAAEKRPLSPSTRIRDNQRRSRARRKEYITELEERLREYERLGAQASQEMQVAAQKVARENTALRTMLRDCGVTAEEMEACVQTTPEDNQRPTSTAKPEAENMIPCHNSLSHQPAHDAPTQEDASQLSIMNRQGRSATMPTIRAPTKESSAASILPRTSESASSSQSYPISVVTAPSETHLQRPIAGQRNQFVDQGEPGEEARKIDEDDATSCETAAWIIANLRGHDNAEEVRTELGCKTNMDCTVKNLTVFNAMDR